ncbi:hypothetical protein TWF281_011292 [Arthrobotrys megalospora]
MSSTMRRDVVPLAVSLPWDFGKRITGEQVVQLIRQGYSYEAHGGDTLLFFRADEREQWRKASRGELLREIHRLGFLQGDTWTYRYVYELVRYGRTLLTHERDHALEKGDLYLWSLGPESQRVLSDAREILRRSGEKRSGAGKRKRETVREDEPEPEYIPAASEAKRRRTVPVRSCRTRAAARAAQPQQDEDVVMTEQREESVVPIPGPKQALPSEMDIPREDRTAAAEGPREEPRAPAAAPERRRRTVKAAIKSAPVVAAPVVEAQAPALAIAAPVVVASAPTEEAVAPVVEAQATAAQAVVAAGPGPESCGWGENNGNVCSSVFSTKLELQNHVLSAHVPTKKGLPEGQSDWRCRFGRCSHSYNVSEARKSSGVFDKCDTMKSHIRYVLDAREYGCRYEADGCTYRANRLNDVNTHAPKCKFKPKGQTEEGEGKKKERKPRKPRAKKSDS